MIFTEADREEIKQRVADGDSVRALAREYHKKYIAENPNDPITVDGVRAKIRRLVNDPSYKQPKLKVTPDMSKSSNSYNAIDKSTTFERIIALEDGAPITPESIMEAHNLDKNLWDVVTYKNNYYSQQAKGGKIVVLYQSKIIVRPKTEGITLEKITDHFNNLASTYTPAKYSHTENNSDKLYEINIADLHFGKLGTSGVCGEDYNVEIAKENFFKVINTEISRIKKGKYAKILFVWSNDFFNADGISGATTKGTAQDNVLQWQDMFLQGCEILVKAIDALREYAPVETFYIASNHSRQIDFYAINYLSAWFRQCDDVVVNVNLTTRYYYRWGVNLIGFAHSSYEKKNNLPYLMSVERPKDWAETLYREYHLAHIHSESVTEKGGVVFRWLPSITGADAWHSECGYVGATKRSYSFVWDKVNGLETINCTFIES